MKLEDYSKYYIQGSDHYLVPKEVFVELFNEMINWKEENEESKKQLDEANKKLYLCTPEIPQNIHEKYVSYVDLVNEIYELKKQLAQYQSDIDELYKTDNPFDNFKYKNTKYMIEENKEVE